MNRREFCKAGVAGAGILAFSNNIHAIKPSVFASDKKQWAVLYGSQCGSTREYANYINEGLGGIADVVDIEKTTPKVDDYNFFIIGGWRYGNNVMPAKIPNFVKSNKSVLQGKIKGMFVVLGNRGNPTLQPDMTNFLKTALITPAGVNENLGKIFFGRYDPVCGKQGGNAYDNVKKDDGVAFGKKILAENQTGIFQSSSEVNRSLDLHCSSGLFGYSPKINYTLPIAGYVELTVCSIHGQKVATMVSQYQKAGSYRVSLDGINLAPGQYIYQLKAAGFSKTISQTIAQR